MSFEPWNVLPTEFCRFRSRFGGRITFAFQVQAKRMDYTAVVAKAVLDHFSVAPAGGSLSYRVDRMIMLGFCGTLKADEFKIGDIGIASQVDCYMEKAKIAKIEEIDLCGEVYRTSQKYVRLGQNLRHVDPTGFEEFRTDCQNRRDRDVDAFARPSWTRSRSEFTRHTSLRPRSCPRPPARSSGYAGGTANCS